jgi:16S rRNA processing protein RimM
VARVARSRGIRGEVLADYHTDFPGRFDRLGEVWVSGPGLAPERRTVEDAWDHNGRLVLKLAGVDSVEAADSLAGAWIEVDAGDAEPLPEGTYYDHDLVGCTVVSVAGEILGEVKEVLRLSGNHQLVIERAGGECLIPARAEICVAVSIPERRITVDLPEGLIDLNR